MDDEKLLMLAAKAAGIIVERARLNDPLCRDILVRTPVSMYEQRFCGWNPLTNDGDALRLAVQLSIGMQSNGPDHWQSPNCVIVLFGENSRLTHKHDGNAIYAARRAIVRAAASMGGSDSRDTTIGPHTHTDQGGIRD